MTEQDKRGRALAWILGPAQGQDISALREVALRLRAKEFGDEGRVVCEIAHRALWVSEAPARSAKYRPLHDEIRRLERKLWPEDYPAPSDVVVPRDDLAHIITDIESALSDLAEAGSGKKYDMSWIAPMQLSRQQVRDKATTAYHLLWRAKQFVERYSAALRQGGGG